MEIILHLSGHCIETAAKRRYEKLVQELLREENEERERELEAELELLLDFLKNADFSELRKSGFDGSREMRVRVKKEDERFVVKEV
jgi:hypothetical protein